MGLTVSEIIDDLLNMGDMDYGYFPGIKGQIYAHYSYKRYYHNLDHIYETIDLVNWYEKNNSHCINYDLIKFALVYHDIVWANEEASSEMACNHAKTFGMQEHTRMIHELIMATCNKKVSWLLHLNIIKDADFAILGSNEYKYNQYVKNVKREYMENLNYSTGEEWDNLWKINRKIFLNDILKNKYIFNTTLFIKNYEFNARKNIINELNNY